MVTCFGRSCSHLQASLKAEQVPWCAHNMGSHMFTCVCTGKVEEHLFKSLRRMKHGYVNRLNRTTCKLLSVKTKHNRMNNVHIK
jgi:hypothetical protein